ncbi:hypothetical protein [Neoroseomonas lacus]|nr:hypothetical protein [Neoroseomonas lacus]
MTSMLFMPDLAPGAIDWLTAILAAAGGMVLHTAIPPQDPAIAEALLQSAIHP